jgi:hypothetical protein
MYALAIQWIPSLAYQTCLPQENTNALLPCTSIPCSIAPHTIQLCCRCQDTKLLLCRQTLQADETENEKQLDQRTYPGKLELLLILRQAKERVLLMQDKIIWWICMYTTCTVIHSKDQCLFEPLTSFSAQRSESTSIKERYQHMQPCLSARCLLIVWLKCVKFYNCKPETLCAPFLIAQYSSPMCLCCIHAAVVSSTCTIRSCKAM